MSTLTDGIAPLSVGTEHNVPYYLQRYPHISQAALDTAGLIKRLPQAGETDNFPDGVFELEARFGKVSSDPRTPFCTGVSKEFMLQTLNLLQEFGAWQKVGDWEEYIDYFYIIDEGPPVRTSSYADPNTHDIVTEHIRKHVRDKQDYRIKPLTHQPPNNVYDIRVSLNFEEKVDAAKIPTYVTPSFVRIKSRKRFFYGHDESKEPLWVYDLTRSWSGSTKEEAENKQKNDETQYEIECECLDAVRYMADVDPQFSRQDESYVATSLLLKMARMFDVEQSKYEMEPMRTRY